VPGDRFAALSTLQQGRRQECRRSVFARECLDQGRIGGTLAAGLSEGATMKLSARGAQREESGEVARQRASSAVKALAKPSGGGGRPKGQPDHPRLGRSVSLRAQHARAWLTADIRAQPAQSMVVAQI
jgi:hypothetical protein